jgi:predicted AlkP superfamily phosphohydrolase/phosphomutase
LGEAALVIGLDGMPRTFMLELVGAGLLPNIADLLGAGYCAELVAPVPEISSTSWATFLTGANPGRHGIYGFTDLAPGGYRVHFPDVTHLREPALWELAARAGRRTVCCNVPGTYPAPAIAGTLISGFVAAELERAVHPPELIGVLRGFGYELDVEVGDVARDPNGFLGRAARALRARTDALEYLLGRERWDLAVAVLTETDRVQHFLWRAGTDPAHPMHGDVLDFYGLVDECVGRLARTCRPGTELFLVSDHGFGPVTCQFYVNAWLREAGWLAALEVSPAPDRMDARSNAFALDPARIYLHRNSRFPGGGLTDGEADHVAGQIAAELRELRYDAGRVGPRVDGPKLLREVYRAAEVYHGPHLGRAPDLIAVPAPGVQPRGAWAGSQVVREDALTGTHTRDNAIFYRRSAAADQDAGPLDMVDVLPTVLSSIGVPCPGLDGTPALGLPTPITATKVA